MKVRKGTQGNKQKEHQADDGANEEIGQEGKRYAEKKRKRPGSSPCQGRRPGF